MRIRYGVLAAAGLIAAAAFQAARADIQYTQGSGTTLFDFICFTTKHCTAHANINSAGTEIMTPSNPAYVAGADGANVVEGATTDAAATAGGAGTLSAKARLMTSQLNTINTTLGSPFQAGGSIGNTAFGISGTVPNPTTAASWGLLAQGTTTSGQLGGLMMGSVLTSAPTYTNGQTSPVVLDAAGNLKVNVAAGGAGGGAVYGPTANGSAAANPPVLMGGTANGTGTGTVQNWKVDSSGTGYIDCVAGGTLCTALANGVQTAGSAVSTQLIAWSINVGGNARQPTGSNPTGTFYAAHQDQIAINGVTVSTGAGAVGAGSQRMAVGQDTTTIAGSAPGTAGTPSAQVVSVQGVANGTPQPVQAQASATGGATASGGVAANSNNSTNIKASAGTVYGLQTSNINASTAYWIKLYDKATAPTCGTDTPVARYVIPPSNGGNNVQIAIGKAFSNGIGICIVTGIADNDNTSVPAATIVWNLDWK